MRLTYLIYGAGLAFFASIVLGLLTFINYLRFPQMPAGYPTLVFLISLFGSFTLGILGIIGRYLANIYTEVRGRPLFNIDKKINCYCNNSYLVLLYINISIIFSLKLLSN